MKVMKFASIVVSITLMTLIYTHQRIEAIRYSYEISSKEANLNKLLDRQKELEYNVARLKAPMYLELQLAKRDVKMVLPERWQVFETTGLLEEKEVSSAMPLFVRNIVSFLSLKSEAQATPADESHPQ